MSDAAAYRQVRGLWHAGLGPALYATGLTAALLQLSGRWVEHSGLRIGLALGATLAGAFSMMLLDRVKWSDSQFDPADAEANPRRAAFVRGNARAWRMVVAVSAAIGMAGAWITGGPIGSACVAFGVGAISLYAGRPASDHFSAWRLKDIPVVKNAFVALGLVGLSLAVVFGRQLSGEPELLLAPPVRGVAIALLLFALADAMLCDFPDMSTDRAFGTRTIPVLLGRLGSTAIAVAASMAGALVLVLWSVKPNQSVAWLWAIAMPAFAIASALAPRPATKASVDARPVCVAIIGGALLAASSGAS